MGSRILYNNGLEIDQALSGAYSNIITRGSGFVRDTGVQNISGVKYFYDRITFFSGLNVTGDFVITGDVVGNLSPKIDDLYNLGSSTSEWKDLWIDGTARIDSLHVDEAANFSGDISAHASVYVLGNSTVTGNSTIVGDFIPANFAAHFLPKNDNVYDLGSPSQEIRNLYVDGSGRIDTLQVDENATIEGTGQFSTVILTGTSVPASQTAVGTRGQLAVDFTSGYLYVCTGTNLWGRTHLTGWI
jgi:hypothetical protein